MRNACCQLSAAAGLSDLYLLKIEEACREEKACLYLLQRKKKNLREEKKKRREREEAPLRTYASCRKSIFWQLEEEAYSACPGGLPVAWPAERRLHGLASCLCMYAEKPISRENACNQRREESSNKASERREEALRKRREKRAASARRRNNEAMRRRPRNAVYEEKSKWR